MLGWPLRTFECHGAARAAWESRSKPPTEEFTAAMLGWPLRTFECHGAARAAWDLGNALLVDARWLRQHRVHPVGIEVGEAVDRPNYLGNALLVDARWLRQHRVHPVGIEVGEAVDRPN